MTKYSKVLLLNITVLLAAVAFAGCNSRAPANNAAQANQPAADKPAIVTETNKKPETAKPKAQPDSTDETASTGNRIGIPECDEYIKKYEACVFSAASKVPEAQRNLFRSTFENSRNAWKQAAATPQGKETLPNICKQALENAKQIFATYSCAW